MKQKAVLMCGLAFFGCACGWESTMAAHPTALLMFCLPMSLLAASAGMLESVVNPLLVTLAAGGRLLLGGQALTAAGALVVTGAGMRVLLLPLENGSVSSFGYNARSLPLLGVSVLYRWLASVALGLSLTVIAVRFPVGLSSKIGGFQIYPVPDRWLTISLGACFLYFGAQVCVWSSFLQYTRQVSDVTLEQAGDLLLLSYGLFTLGRFASIYFLHKVNASRLLFFFAMLATVLTAISTWQSNIRGVFCLVLCNFFMSSIYPVIFSLALSRGTDVNAGGPLLVATIIAGGVLPPLMAWIADRRLSYGAGLLVPALCFAGIAVYAAMADSRVGREQCVTEWLHLE